MARPGAAIVARRIGGVIAGLAIAWLLVLGAEALVHVLYPPPAGANMQDMETMKRFVATLPVAAMLMVLLGWAVGTLAGTYAATRIGWSPVPGWVVGALLFAGGIANASMIPQPAWLTAASLVVFVVMTWLGTRLGRARAAGVGA
jgi:hypothetical protein